MLTTKSSRAFKMAAFVAGFLVIGYGAYHANRAYWHRYFDEAVCSESVNAQFTSPRGQFTATVYTRNCGATTDYVTHVNLHSNFESPKSDPDGVIRGGELFLEPGEKKIRGDWRDESNLILTVIGVEKIARSEERMWGSVKVQIR
jgi:hypothetical protein